MQLSFTTITFSQNIIWDKIVGGALSQIQQTSDGGYILGGNSYSETKNGYRLIKLTTDGSKVWEKAFVGNGSNYHFTALQQTRDGGYILGGYSTSGLSGDKSQPGKGSYDYWIIKLDKDGQKVWDNTIGGDDADNLSVLQQTSDGGYILGGSSSSGKGGDKTSASKDIADGLTDYWIVKIKAAGG